jgi:hypothetical protein
MDELGRIAGQDFKAIEAAYRAHRAGEWCGFDELALSRFRTAWEGGQGSGAAAEQILDRTEGKVPGTPDVMVFIAQATPDQLAQAPAFGTWFDGFCARLEAAGCPAEAIDRALGGTERKALPAAEEREP